MKRLVCAGVAVTCLSLWAAEADTGALEQEARALVREFSAQLKPRLQAALQAGGPTRAVEVCATEAPVVADALAATSGWTVKRVSLKVRNASRATPDAWETEVLEEFERRRNAGEEPAALYRGEVVESRYRYLQAQVVEPVCLTCHGANLAAPVREALEQYYPDDEATGYELGQVRGAFSLSRQVSGAAGG